MCSPRPGLVLAASGISPLLAARLSKFSAPAVMAIRHRSPSSMVPSPRSTALQSRLASAGSTYNSIAPHGTQMADYPIAAFAIVRMRDAVEHWHLLEVEGAHVV